MGLGAPAVGEGVWVLRGDLGAPAMRGDVWVLGREVWVPQLGIGWVLRGVWVPQLGGEWVLGGPGCAAGARQGLAPGLEQRN